MQDGYVLDFSNRTFAMHLADLGVDIDEGFGPGSKATRLRAFLRTAEPPRVAAVLAALLEHRGEHEGDTQSKDLRDVRGVIARLGSSPTVSMPTPTVDVLSLGYVHELGAKTERRLADGDLEGAITLARTMLEAVLGELERQLVQAPCDHKGDLQRLFKSVAKGLHIDDERDDLDENFKQVARGLVQVVNGLAPIRNKMSDGHPRTRRPATHHARVMVNASRTVAAFLVESYVFQRERRELRT